MVRFGAQSRLLRGAAAVLAAAHLLGPCTVQCDDPSGSPVGSLRALLAPTATAAEPVHGCCADAHEPAAPDGSHRDRCSSGCPGRAEIVAAHADRVSSLAPAGSAEGEPIAGASALDGMPAAAGDSPMPGTTTAAPAPRALSALTAACVLLI
jgi:hypothetical protein